MSPIDSPTAQPPSDSPEPIELREVRPAEVPLLFAHQADPEAQRMAAVPMRDREGTGARVVDPDGVPELVFVLDE